MNKIRRWLLKKKIEKELRDVAIMQELLDYHKNMTLDKMKLSQFRPFLFDKDKKSR